MAHLRHALQVVRVDKALKIASVRLDVIDDLGHWGIRPPFMVRALTARGSSELISA
jgi:hypothetical protein